MSDLFQVNLGGIVDLLARHLYSSPTVYLRELLQNANDAIVERRRLEPDHVGAIRIETQRDAAGRHVLIVEDDGAGLTAEQIGAFLATIGASSKAGDADRLRSEVIGQFGIGLLAAFLVGDEITVTTRSATDGATSLEWVGRADGTHRTRDLAESVPVGTRVRLVAREGDEDLVDPERVLELAREFGELLPCSITVDPGGVVITRPDLPWAGLDPDAPLDRTRLLEYGRTVFREDLGDVIALDLPSVGVSGVAFVTATNGGWFGRPVARVYLKRMLLHERLPELLPPWAFFLRAVVDLRGVRPTASREALYEDEQLAAVRDAIGVAVRTFILSLSTSDPRRLDRLLRVHALALKAFAADDEEAFAAFGHLLRVETTLGDMPIGALRTFDAALRFARTEDEFRQLLPVAASSGICVVNGGNVYDVDLLERLVETQHDLTLERVGATDLVDRMEQPSTAEDAFARLLAVADRVLADRDTRVDIRRFEPDSLPAILTVDAEAQVIRDLQVASASADPLWAGIIDGLAPTTSDTPAVPMATLSLNSRNAVVRTLAGAGDEAVLRRGVTLLYLQSLILARRPLGPADLELLTSVIAEVIDPAASPPDAVAPAYARGLN